MTSADRSRQTTVDELVADAMELPAGQRRDFLLKHVTDPDLLAETISLIEFAARLDEEDAVRGTVGGASGERIGPYELKSLLGRGAFGDVYLALREDVGQRVALKLLKSTVDYEAPVRFESEARVLAALDHPNITRLIDYGRTDAGQLYLVTELADGGTLGEWVRLNKPSLPELLRLFIKICDAVQFAHTNLIVHRDIKPSNILLDTRGNPKLADFGIVQMLGSLATAEFGFKISQTRGGTPKYASPEQFRGDPVTTASDVYSLGVVLTELVAELGHAKPDDLDGILRCCVQHSPRARYANAGELRDELSALLAHRPVKQGRRNWAHLAALFVRRNRAAVATSAAGLLLLVGASGWIWHQNSQLKKREVELRAALARHEQSIQGVMVAVQNLDRAQASKYAPVLATHQGARSALADAERIMQLRAGLQETFHTAVTTKTLGDVLLRADGKKERLEGLFHLRKAREMLRRIQQTNPDYPDLRKELDEIDTIEKELDAGKWSGGTGFAAERIPPKLGPRVSPGQALADARTAKALWTVWQRLGDSQKADAAYQRAISLYELAAGNGLPEAATERDDLLRLFAGQSH